MKKTFINIRAAALKTLAGSLVLLALLAFVLPQAAQASTASNTVIRNIATVNYNDTANNPMPSQSSTVDITVAYQCAAPTLDAPGDTATQPGTPADYIYTITSNSNGPDTYNLTASNITQSAGINGSTVSFWQGVTSITSVTLGASTAAATAAIGTAIITVPNDNSNNSSVNGIVATDTVVIGGNSYTVQSISDGGTTVPGTSTITLTTNLTTAVVAGDPIYERQTFTTRVTPGTVTASSNQTIDVTTQAIGTTACGAAQDVTQTTVNVASLTISKEVSPDGSSWYITSNAPQFLPGATVYYRITVRNTGSSNANAATLTDPMPAYTTYVAGSTLLNEILVNDLAGVSQLVTGLLVDDNASRTSGSIGTGVLPPYTSGPAGEAIVKFRVTVN